MMFRRLVFHFAEQRQLRELEKFVGALSTMSDVEMGELLLIVTDVRHSFAKSGGGDLLEPTTVTLKRPDAASGFALASHTALKSGNAGLAAAYAVWGLTCRSAMSANLSPRARLMWRELARGHAHLDAAWRQASTDRGISVDLSDARKAPRDFQ